jgi:hypothetical protein
MPASVKNLTFDCVDALREEVDRPPDLGATVAERFDDLTVMHDPEGNEFRVELGPADPARPRSLTAAAGTTAPVRCG